jgi:hypothetical protein
MENQEPRSHARLAVSIILLVVIGASLIGAAYLRSNSPASSTSTPKTSSQSTASSSIQTEGGASANCITVVPYDSMQKQFEGCGVAFSVLYNGDYYTQTFPNGTQKANLGWTLLIEASQTGGPSENVTFGWDPAGPSTPSGERLPGPVSSTLFNQSLTMQWRLYNSTSPRLYAWIIAPSPSSSQQTTSGESASCPATSWPSSVSTWYQPVVQQIEQNPAFVTLTNSLCYSFALNANATYQGQSFTTFIFNQYNGTVIYPCGTFPAKLIVSQIQVNVILNGTEINEIVSMDLNNETTGLNVSGCTSYLPPVWVHSVMLVPPYTPAGPTIEVNLYAAPGQTPITNLTAVLSLTGKNQTFQFSGVSASSPLLPGQLASQTETIIGPVSVDTNSIYPMMISGTFQNGQAFSYQVQIQIEDTSPRVGETSSTSTEASANSALVAQCPNSGPESGFGTVTAGTRTPALLCVRLFYYSTTPLTVNLTAALSIQALQYIANGSVNYPRSFSGASNFTVTASQSQLTIGGPNDENEGATIAYGVAAKPGSSGTYWLSFLKSSGLSAYVLDPQEPISCAFDGELVAGSGQPDYTQGFNGCITYTTTNQSGSTTTSKSSAPIVPGIPYSLTTGYIYFEIVGVANSTG